MLFNTDKYKLVHDGRSYGDNKRVLVFRPNLVLDIMNGAD